MGWEIKIYFLFSNWLFRFHAFAEISVFVDELRDSSQNKAECEVPEFPTKLVGGMPPGNIPTLGVIFKNNPFMEMSLVTAGYS